MPGSPVAASERLDTAAFQALFDRCSNWGRWGADDQRGTLNLITPEVRIRAAGLVKEGATVSVAHPVNTTGDAENTSPAVHLMVRAGDVFDGVKVTSIADHLAVSPHGQAHSHLDALCHFAWQGKMYNGRPITDVTSTGARTNAITIGQDGIVSRGVLLDVPRHLGLEFLEPRAGLPDFVFTANAGLMFRDRFYSSRFRHPERAGETPLFDDWFAAQGFRVEHFPEGRYHEGAGDALFCGETLFAGYRTRSDAAGHQWLGQEIGVRVLPLELVNPRFYHLDTCFCPLAPGVALYHPEAFDGYGQKVLKANVPTLIPVVEAEAWRFGCNAVVVGRQVVHNSGCPQMGADLTAHGFTPHEVTLDEFLKAGGSAKCLTLRLDGEEAAAW